jgi:ABC-type cobalamin/Fe3+-siderophores transport system ATPase subunit
MTSCATLELQNLTASYGEHTVLEDVSLEIYPGEVLALIGPNGSGKSTLVKSLSGVLRPKGGSARVKGQDVYSLSHEQRAKALAVVPQARNLPEGYTVWQTVLIGRTPYLGWLGQPNEKDIERTRWALKRTGMEDYAERQINELSGGEQQRVLVARALAQETPVLLLDEPTAHLDLRYQSLVLSLVRELAREQALAVLMVLHDLNLVALYADRVALLVDGRLRAVGTPMEVITPSHLTEAYQVPVQVIPHPDSGAPLIFPGGQKLN